MVSVHSPPDVSAQEPAMAPPIPVGANAAKIKNLNRLIDEKKLQLEEAMRRA